MLLEIRNITKSFGEKQVLKGNFPILCRGSGAGTAGPQRRGQDDNHPGSSCRFSPADSGRVLLDGQPLDAARVRIGYLPE